MFEMSDKNQAQQNKQNQNREQVKEQQAQTQNSASQFKQQTEQNTQQQQTQNIINDFSQPFNPEEVLAEQLQQLQQSMSQKQSRQERLQAGQTQNTQQNSQNAQNFHVNVRKMPFAPRGYVFDLINSMAARIRASVLVSKTKHGTVETALLFEAVEAINKIPPSQLKQNPGIQVFDYENPIYFAINSDETAELYMIFDILTNPIYNSMTVPQKLQYIKALTSSKDRQGRIKSLIKWTVDTQKNTVNSMPHTRQDSTSYLKFAIVPAEFNQNIVKGAFIRLEKSFNDGSRKAIGLFAPLHQLVKLKEILGRIMTLLVDYSLITKIDYLARNTQPAQSNATSRQNRYQQSQRNMNQNKQGNNLTPNNPNVMLDPFSQQNNQNIQANQYPINPQAIQIDEDELF